MSDYLRSQTGEGLGFFAFTPVAVAVWGVACLFFLTIGRRLLPGLESQVSLADRYEVTEYLTEVMASASSDMVGQPLGALDLGPAKVSILGVIRNEENLAPSPWVVIEPGDVLIIQGNISKISELMGKPGMSVREEMQVGDTTLRSVDLRMVEAVIGPASQFQNRRLADLDFHKQYNLSVLAIGRHGRPLSGRPMEQELQIGDSLLLVGHEEMIQRLRDDPNVFLLESRTLPIVGKAWTAIAWMIAMVLAQF